MSAALLLSSGSLADRVGARTAFGRGIGLFVIASIACGAAPGLGLLVAARLVQGTAAAVTMPASLSLISQAYPDRVRRGRAVAFWAPGGSVASTSGPLVGGILAALAVAALSLVAFVVAQARVAHPVVPLALSGSRSFRIALGTGFPFMVGYYGLCSSSACTCKAPAD